ncbi:MAG: hypothetical protein ABFD24_05925 [Anaerolineaceae bacterium]
MELESTYILHHLSTFVTPKIKLTPIAYGRVLPIGSWILAPTGVLTFTKSLRIEIRCPFCGKLHLHGYDDDPQKLVPSRGAGCGRGIYLLAVEKPANEQ